MYDLKVFSRIQELCRFDKENASSIDSQNVLETFFELKRFVASCGRKINILFPIEVQLFCGKNIAKTIPGYVSMFIHFV